MNPDTQTTTRLLEGLFDPANDGVWREFDARYRPILVAFARRLGLSEADAHDAAQDTLVRFVEEYRQGKYDRSRGRLRSWLVTIARYRVIDIQRAGVVRREMVHGSAVENQLDEQRLSAIWDAECRASILRRAISELRTRSRMDPRTIRAFELIAIDRLEPSIVAHELGMKTEDVYLAKHRALEKLQQIVAELTELYELVG